MSSFCKLIYGKGIGVQDLGLSTQNANILNELKNTLISDKPLDSTVGGICLYYNKQFDEVGLCITTANNLNPTHLVYSELNEVMVTKKQSVIALAVNMPGELLTVGRNINKIGIDSNKLWRENSNILRNNYYNHSYTNSLEVEFVCNENVYSSKKFDKLVMYLSGNENSQKFTNFTFTDSVSNANFSNTGTGSKMLHGKHIIPITSTDGTSKATGQHLTINCVSTNTGEIELFGALVHNRITK